MTAYFRLVEFRCRCNRLGCDAKPMDLDFLKLLNQLREAWAFEMIIASGARCAVHNAEVGGAPDSMHLLGKAADIKANPTSAKAIASLAAKMGFGGIGVGKSLIHLDSGIDGRRWTYDY